MRAAHIVSFILLSVLSTTVFAQTKNYEAQWKKIDSLVFRKGLTRSALDQLQQIYTQAKKEKNDAQVIKVLIYRLDLENALQDEGADSTIRVLEKEIAIASQPARSILQSQLAGTYLNYFNENRWRLYNRTETTNFQKDDVATWSVNDFHRKISQLYLASISQAALLQRTGLSAYDPIIISGNARYLRPTLFDLLAHHALDYFESDERNISRPAYAFELDHPVVFADAATFAAHRFATADTLSLHHKALLLHQQLISFHLKDSSPAPLIDEDIRRIQFVNSYAVMENKDSLYYAGLQSIVKKYPNERTAAQAWYLIAETHAAKARAYDPLKDTTGRYEYVAARRICEQVLLQKHPSEGRSNCQNLLNEILAKDFQLQVEKVNLPGQPFRMLTTYRNVTQLYFRLVKIDKTTKEKLTGRYGDMFYNPALLTMPVMKRFSQLFPATTDHQRHSAEMKVDGLPVGEYALLVSSDSAFNQKKDPLGVQHLYVSGIAYLNNGYDYFVLHRETGQPLRDANVQVWNFTYDNKKNAWVEKEGSKLKTDKNGFFRLPQPKNIRDYGQVKLEIKTGNDHLYLDDQESYRYYQPQDEEDFEDYDVDEAEDYEEDHRKTFLFTDRSLYRPGQTVYFKGIMVTRDFKTGLAKTVAGVETMVFLYDQQGETVDSLQVTTSEYGSYSGKFRLPENRLNGAFNIQDDETEGEVQFSVEEYKRPKFYVEYKKVEGTYRIMDTISVTGFAKAYAGNNIDGALVRYRVVRQARFPYPWLFWRWGFPTVRPQEIAHGEMKTATDGKFVVRFTAIPDKNIRKDFEPLFDYSIMADVTDINGETRSGTSVVRVGYKALELNVIIPGGETMPSDSLKQLMITTRNMAGQFEPAKVRVVMHRLNAPQRLIRSRYWQQPDQFVMSQAEYLQHFPYDEYSNETKKESWEKLEKVFEKTDSTRSSGVFTMNGSSLQPSTFNLQLAAGIYSIEVTTTDKYGQEVKDVKYVNLLDSKTGMPASPAYQWELAAVQTRQPGQTAQVETGTSAKDVFLVQQLNYPARRNARGSDSVNVYQFSNLSNQKKTISVPVTEVHRGGFSVFHTFIKHNRFYTATSTVDVPWTNKELNITYETYRDKALPGSEEKWKVKLAGSQQEKVSAEILTAMYDASLDQFKPHGWIRPPVWPVHAKANNWSGANNFSTRSFILLNSTYPEVTAFEKEYDQLRFSIYGGLAEDGRPVHNKPLRTRSTAAPEALQGRAPGLVVPDMAMDGYATSGNANMQEVVVVGYGSKKREVSIAVTSEAINTAAPEIPVQVRKNFNETAFFFPDLKTDSAGNVEFSFTLPEALTQWKWMMLSHTKDMAMSYSEKTIITQKELMVQPNIPRFVREGDRMDLSAKIVNLGEKELSGQIELQLVDATTNQSVDGWFQNMFPNQYFTAEAGQSTAINFTVQIPYQYNRPMIIRFIARAGNVSDGEENSIPVLSNKLLVTETLPLNVRGTGTKNFTFDKLLKSGQSETLSHHALTVEFTGNPAWYAVQALPYLMEFPYECAEQVWNRVYANALAAKIVNASPRIKAIFEKWKTTDTAALLSNLEKNQELKSILLQETPWVMQAKNETEQKKRIALLFDMAKLGSELNNNLDKLAQMQSNGGGFPWFKGGRDDRYITQYILTGIGHLKKLNAIPAAQQQKIDAIVASALPYLDSRIKEDYDQLVKSKADLNKQQLSYMQVHYLYMRSFFTNINAAGSVSKAFSYYRKQSQQFWLQQGRYSQGMIALSLYRTGDGKTATDVLRSLKQNAIVSQELGMYWKDMNGGYYWYQAPIETQALLIEAFTEIAKDITTVDALKTWLLKNKQTTNWRTTKATADACYALLLQGTDWLSSDPIVQIKLGDKSVSSLEQKSEAGSGYFKKVFDAPFVNNTMGNISVNVTQPDASGKPINTTSWGAVYWQYFESLENITPAATPLNLKKQLFVERNTDRGPMLEPIANNASLKTGDKIKVRIELRVDRDMEYVHMKDMRAAALEPVNVLSGYKWQGGLGYYESTKDASTNFFFDYLRKGTYVFEYPLFITHTGNFSNGITTIQCMYAPEFSSHSEGIKFNVD
jgi:hypothetical protein